MLSAPQIDLADILQQIARIPPVDHESLLPSRFRFRSSLNSLRAAKHFVYLRPAAATDSPKFLRLSFLHRSRSPTVMPTFNENQGRVLASMLDAAFQASSPVEVDEILRSLPASATPEHREAGQSSPVVLHALDRRLILMRI